MKKKLFSFVLIFALVFAFVPAVTVSAMGDSFSTVSVGGGHILVIRNDGALWAWGDNRNGALGDGTTVNRDVPVKIMDDVVAVSAGYIHSLALKSDGTLWAWGYNGYGRLGDGTEENRLLPVKIMDSVTAVSAGMGHSLAIKNDGTLWAWGMNSGGELGDGTTEDKSTPVKIMDGVITVSAGSYYNLAVKSDRTLWAWGMNYIFQLGDGTDERKITPTKILDDVIAVSADHQHSFAIKSDGSLWAWGWNFYGQLGDGTTWSKATPVKCILDDVMAALPISAGYGHSFAIKSDCSLWAWGNVYIARLSDNSITSNTAIVKVMDDVAAIIQGGYIKNDGSLWFWEYDRRGTLGDGNPENKPNSIKIMDGVMLPVVPTPPPPAEKPSAWAAEQVSRAISLGLVPQPLQSKYTQDITRAEFCALAVRLYETVTGKEIIERLTFSDTKDINVEKAAAIGVVNGVGGDRFDPDGKLNREQAATMLSRLAAAIGKPLTKEASTFADNASLSSWALEAVGQVQAAGIMQGVGNNMFSPKGPYTREQSIATILRLYDIVK